MVATMPLIFWLFPNLKPNIKLHTFSLTSFPVFLAILMTVNMMIPCGASAGYCFTCKDKERCIKLIRIYGSESLPLWERTVNDPLPECNQDLLSMKTCFVCLADNTVMIHANISSVDAEIEGRDLKLTPADCMSDM